MTLPYPQPCSSITSSELAQKPRRPNMRQRLRQEMLDAHRDALTAVVAALEEREVVSGPELEAIVAAHPPSRPLQLRELGAAANGAGSGGGNGHGHSNGGGDNGAGAHVRQAQGASAQ